MNGDYAPVGARRAANTPVDGVERADMLVKLARIIARNIDDERYYSAAPFQRAADEILTLLSPALPSKVVGVSLADATTALERSLESEGSGINAYLRDDIEQAIAVMRSCLTSPAAEPVAWVNGEKEIMRSWLTRYCAELRACGRIDDAVRLERIFSIAMSHPAPSASREVTITDEMVRAADAAHERYYSKLMFDQNTGPSASDAMRAALTAALLAALPEREG